MIEWKVVEEGEELGEVQRRAQPSRSRAWRWIVPLLILALLGIVGGGVRWQLYEQERALRADLTEIVKIEARHQGYLNVEQLHVLIDPAAPAVWRARYLLAMSQQRVLPSNPTVQALRWSEGGGVALIEVVWPYPGGTFIEPRAYRLKGERWYRTALPLAEEPVQEQEGDLVTLRASAAELAWATEVLDLEGLHTHLVAHWPHGSVAPFTLLIKPQELAPLIEDLGASGTLRANSRAFFLPDLTSHLSTDAQYRLRLTEAILRYRLLPWPAQRPGIDTFDHFSFQQQLLAAEARYWVLDEAERARLRAQWRAELEGHWESPFSAPLSGSDKESVRRRTLATAFLLDYLILTQGRAVPGQLAAQLDSAPAYPAHATLILGSGVALETLDEEVRAFALTP